MSTTNIRIIAGVLTIANGIGSVLAESPAPVVLYEHCSFGGYQVPLSLGDYNMEALLAQGMRNDDISAIQVQPGYKVTLYEHAGFQGQSWIFTADSPCFVDAGLNDVVSSVRIEQIDKPSEVAAVSVYEHCGYEGYRVDLPEGNHDLADLQNRGMINDDISAIRVPPGYSVILYEHAGFEGRRWVINADTACFTEGGLNDVVSSIQVISER